MEKNKIIVVGAGISGLSAGIHALLKGFDVEIYESHNLVGGLCTAWKRKDQEIDGCIHWLTGSKPGTPFHALWKTCGALSDETGIVNHEHISSYMSKNGETYHLYSDIKKMENELMRISPEDEKEIKHFIRLVKTCQGINPPCEKPEEMMNLFDWLKFILPIIPKGKKMQFLMNISVSDYVKRFKSPIIQKLLLSTTPNDLFANALFFMLGLRTNGDGGWVQGGSLRFAQRMQERFIKLGGKIFLNNKVKNIVVENNRAIGIQIEGKEELIKSDYIIPATDIHTLLYDLLDNKYNIPYYEERFSDLQKYPVISTVLVSIGVEVDLSARPHTLCFVPSQKVAVAENNHPFIVVNHYAYDPDFSKNGNTLVEFLLTDYKYEYWEKLRKNSEEKYQSEKKRIGELMLSELQKIYPETNGKSYLLDVATPLTFKRYCNTYRGAYMSFSSRPGNPQKNYKGTIDGIDNLFIAGQWLMPDGGLPVTALIGKFAVQRICKHKGLSIKFERN